MAKTREIMPKHILYSAEDSVATITLDRPERRNAQDREFLEQLNAAWERAAQDRDVRVILLTANGPHFSAGHDMSSKGENDPTRQEVLGGIAETGTFGLYGWEATHYLGYSRRWRDIPKPSIAAVQGACIAGGLMLAWPCDLIIAADDARFSDPVVLMGIGGVEYHGHTWELGPRKAKEMLFTAKPIGALEAERRGMVNRVVPRERLAEEARALALEIAQMNPHALAMAKRAVNQTLDIMGQQAALQACFDIHQLGHASAYAQTGQFALAGLQSMRAKT
jgi:enoyl-CoA hydratase